MSLLNRYFIELFYKGTCYAGFQVQKNAVTVQSEVEKALEIFFQSKISLTGSSRTDSGVHALQNYFHFDYGKEIPEGCVYNLNSILPRDISIRNIIHVKNGSHCRFDAKKRKYKYFIYGKKNPFLEDRAYYFPYPLNIETLQQAAALITGNRDFSAFSKSRSQVKNFFCDVSESNWKVEEECVVYNVTANRFLRGMVKGLVGTMLQVARGKIGISEFSEIMNSNDPLRADFSVPGSGLFLEKVVFPEGYFNRMDI
jgi:tRNA pseudouridine38-40 synthase